MLHERYLKITIQIGSTTKSYENSLRVDFNVQKQAAGYNGKASIKIYGLTLDDISTLAKSFSYLDTNKARHNKVILEAGYSNNHGVIYSGNIITAETNLDSADYSINLNCVGGYAAAQAAPKRTTIKNAKISDIAGIIAKAYDVSLNFEASDKAIGNFIYNGDPLRALNDLRKYRVTAFVDGDQLIVIDDGKARRGAAVTLIDGEGGLIGSPKLTLLGIDFKCFLNPNLGVGKLVRLASNKLSAINGTYRIRTITFQGSNRTPDWFCIIQTMK